MHLQMDSELQAVAGFMQERFATNTLAPLADELSRIAPLLRGHLDRVEVRPVTLR